VRVSLFVGPRVFICIRREREDGSKIQAATHVTLSTSTLFPLHASPHVPRFYDRKARYVGVFPIFDRFTLVD